MRKRCLIAVLAVCFAAPAFGQDEYGDEIFRYVLDPCRLVVVRRQDLGSNMTYKQQIDFIEAIDPEVSRGVIATLLPLVRDKEFDKRLVLYNLALLSCLRGAGVE